MESKRVQEIVSKFKDKKILVIGDVVIDHYVYGKVERLNPEAPVPILEAQEENEATGGAGNTAKNLAMLGAETTLISVTGSDAWADRLEELAVQEGYKAVLIRDLARPTIRKIRHIVGSQQLLRVDYEKNIDVSGTVEEELITALENQAAKGIDGILVSDYAKGAITNKVAAAIISIGKKYNAVIGADIKPSRAEYFKGVDFISPNLKEAHEILGFNQYENGGRSPAELSGLLAKKMDSDIYLTLSADGVYVLGKDQTKVHVPQSHKVEVFDPSGAGDTSAAVLLLSRLSGASLEESAELANAAGAFVVQKVGSVGLTIEDIDHMISHQHD